MTDLLFPWYGYYMTNPTARSASFTGQIDIAGISRDIRANVRIALDSTALADLLSSKGSGSEADIRRERQLRRMAIAAQDRATHLADMIGAR